MSQIQTVRSWGQIAALSLGLAAGLAAATAARADEGQAKALLKAMSDYLAGDQAISFSYESDLSVVTTDLQKIDFVSSGTVSLSRPDKIRVTRTGGFANVELVFDGTKLSVLGKNLNRYAELDAPGTIDQLIDHLRNDLGIEAPGADLLLSDVYDQLMDPVVDVKDLGSGVVGGVECNHLAFRTGSVDWQIWIATGDEPYPCRYVVTSKLLALAPEYTIEIGDWKAGGAAVSGNYSFDPGNATKVDLSELRDVDELPDLSAQGVVK